MTMTAFVSVFVFLNINSYHDMIAPSLEIERQLQKNFKDTDLAQEASYKKKTEELIKNLYMRGLIIIVVTLFFTFLLSSFVSSEIKGGLIDERKIRFCIEDYPFECL